MQRQRKKSYFQLRNNPKQHHYEQTHAKSACIEIAEIHRSFDETWGNKSWVGAWLEYASLVCIIFTSETQAANLLRLLTHKSPSDKRTSRIGHGNEIDIDHGDFVSQTLRRKSVSKNGLRFRRNVDSLDLWVAKAVR